jgi:superoxide dismutase
MAAASSRPDTQGVRQRTEVLLEVWPTASLNLFLALALGNFWFGWTCLVKKAVGSLAMVNAPAARTPLSNSDRLLLSFDGGEHAHCIDYRNQGPQLVGAFLGHLANREFAARNVK